MIISNMVLGGESRETDQAAYLQRQAVGADSTKNLELGIILGYGSLHYVREP